jgi:hypothetical protein
VDVERIKGAIQWRLGLVRSEADAGQDWEEIHRWLLADHPSRSQTLAAKMAEPLIEIIRCGLLSEDGSPLPNSWQDLHAFLAARRELPNKMALTGASYIENNFRFGDGKTTESTTEQVETSMARENNMHGSTTTNADSRREDPPIPVTRDAAESSSADAGHSAANETDQSATESESANSNPSSLSTQWRYIPVPDDPDKHEEFDQRSAVSPEGLRIIGARVRGKKHKHEGTNCDDWFEFGFSGSWTIIAVSDGAGSKAFSRIGARESCRAALKELSDRLQDHALKARDDWAGPEEGKKGNFSEDDLAVIREALHSAMHKAYDAVAAKAQDLANSEAHKKVLGGRDVEIDDLSGTLLLAVHTTVVHEGVERSFVMACQIGDGMLAAVDGNGQLNLMGIPDSGEFAGQTDFLTSRRKLESANLAGRTFAFFGPLNALMVMTDGVADDYFPNDPGMLRLYGDLAINRVLQLRYDKTRNAHELLASSLKETKLENTHGVLSAKLAAPVEAITSSGERQTVMIRSMETYAEKLGLEIEAVVKSPALLMAGAMSITGEDMCSEEKSPEAMLRIWLDSYHVRGSFDDRTLIVLYREVVS